MASAPFSLNTIQFAGLSRAATPRTPAAAPAAPPARPRTAAAKPAPAPTPLSPEARAAARTERRRWASVIHTAEFATNPAIGAHLLAGTSKPPSEIIGLLRTIAADDKAARDASPAGIAARWESAAKRAGIK